MKRATTRLIFLVLGVGLFSSCGNEGELTLDTDYVVNTDKLAGTPFEGLTASDNVEPAQFLCGVYRTETVESFPIPIFTAMFLGAQDETVQQAIDIANESLGFTAYEYSETWRDDARVIYAVEEMPDIGNPVGHTEVLTHIFDHKQYAERIVTDWAIRISFLPGAYIVAHELGHALGIPGHILIDYENDATSELEPGSIMQSDGGYGTSVMTDYNFMMSMQGQIMQDHLGEAGEIAEDAGCAGDEAEEDPDEEEES